MGAAINVVLEGEMSDFMVDGSEGISNEGNRWETREQKWAEIQIELKRL